MFIIFSKCFRSAALLSEHMKSKTHWTTDVRCPGCHQLFKTTAALVTHFEAPSRKCRMRESTAYADALEIVTGSFMVVKEDEYGDPVEETNAPEW
jgi:hypothetical protein